MQKNPKQIYAKLMVKIGKLVREANKELDEYNENS
tara:strand:+ start:402 stop:506 length:105 start_codon:yes stop_codon:yes gene_type:complete